MNIHQYLNIFWVTACIHARITLIGLLRKSTLLTEHAHDHVPWAPAGWCLMRTRKSSNIPTRKSLLSSYVSWGVKGKLACNAEFAMCHIPHTLSASRKRYHWWDIHQGHTYWDAKGPNAQFSMETSAQDKSAKLLSSQGWFNCYALSSQSHFYFVPQVSGLCQAGCYAQHGKGGNV